jgi:hypothetical protein
MANNFLKKQYDPEPDYIRITELQKRDYLRKQAMVEQYPLRYYNLCNELGILPEDEILWEQGRLEATLDENAGKN